MCRVVARLVDRRKEKEERRRMVESHSRRKVENSTQVEKFSTRVEKSEEYKAIKIPYYVYEELTRLKSATGAGTYGRLIEQLIVQSEIDPLRVADRKIEQLEEELGQIAPHAYGAISQALVLCRWALRLDKARCDALQLELLSVLKEMRREKQLLEAE